MTMGQHAIGSTRVADSQTSLFRRDLQRYMRNGKVEWYEPSLWVIAVYRFGQWTNRVNSRLLRRFLRLVHLPFFAFVTLLTGIHLPRSAKIGGGLCIWHFGGIVVNPDTVIGQNCTIRHGVTIGNRNEEHDVPVLGDHVDIGAGAKILGAIHVGNNVRIGANAVVLCEVPDDSTVVGVPARVICKA